MLIVMVLQSKHLPPGQRYIKKWIIYAALGVPKVNINEWKLKIFGNVEKGFELTYEDLMKMDHIKYDADFHCVTGWSISEVKWEGVQIKKIAELAGVKDDTEWVMFYCLDGYTANVPIEDALSDDAIIALKINGKQLSLEQGFPARPFIPHLYGWKSAKWLIEIEFLKHYIDGYWEERGYNERGNVWEEERFKSPYGKHLRRRALGAFTV